jgi:hypothetical protein
MFTDITDGSTNMKPDIAPAEPRLMNGHATSASKPPIEGSRGVAALLMAQCARTPVALAISQDYAGVPFKVPRPFIVLGWFWIVDAWVSVSCFLCMYGMLIQLLSSDRAMSSCSPYQAEERKICCDHRGRSVEVQLRVVRR